MIYFDTAYILKCYLPEHGFEAVRQLLAHEQSAACCSYGRLELTTAVMRAVRERRLPAAALPTIVSLLAADDVQGVWNWLPVSARLIESAIASARSAPADVFLRAGDALHLACAREHGLDVYTSDRHMLAAAPHFGVRTHNVIP
jgi:predicted nucleic acid-binding protein